MKTSIIAIMAVGLAGGIAATANAEETYYGGLQLGVHKAEGDKISRGTTGLNLTNRKGLGVAGGFFLGKEVKDWRLEFDYTMRNNYYRSINVNNPSTLNLAMGEDKAGGKHRSHSLMVSALYNIADLDDWKAYAGVGIGASKIQLKRFRAGQTLIADDSAWQPAGQVALQLVRPYGDDMGIRHWLSLLAHHVCRYSN